MISSRIAKIAIFDVDGTLYDGNLGVELIKALFKAQVFSREIAEAIFQFYEKYKSGEAEKSYIVDEIYKLYAKGMAGKSVTEIKKIAEQTYSQISHKIFPYTQDIFNLVKEHNFRIVLLSGSPIEMVQILGKEYKIPAQDIIAGVLETKRGKYTGQILSYPGSSEQKLEAFNLWEKVNNIKCDWENSLAIGDNERDLDLLRKVGFQLAINPDPVLADIAKKENYTIVDTESLLERTKKLLQ